MRRYTIRSGLCSATLMLQACAVGPEFKTPAAPQALGYTAASLPETAGTAGVSGGERQRFVSGGDIPRRWWALFRSKPLNDLIERSLKSNPDIKAAQAALTVVRETALAQNGAYYPSVGAGVSASRQKTSAALSPTPNSGALNFSLYTPQVSVAYVPDVFGLNRRTVESLNANSEQARFALIATQITLTANIVAVAIQEASLRAQIDAMLSIVAADGDALDILREQNARGYAGVLAVAAQGYNSRKRPPLWRRCANSLPSSAMLLAALSGGYPDQARAEEFTLASLQLPRRLPVSLPSRLVAQRPDVRQAEANLHAASAQIGVAIANRLPNITLSAGAGFAALSANQIFSGNTEFAIAGASLTQPIFDGGALMHKERAAKAAYLQASEQYQSTVLAAFQNVADTLAALVIDATALKSAKAAADAAATALTVTRRQAAAGYGDNLALASAKIIDGQARTGLVQAEANRYLDTAALFQALGGGWWNRDGSVGD